MFAFAPPHALALAGRLPTRVNELRATLRVDHLLLQASIALATIGLVGWPAYAGELVSNWIGARAR